MKEKKKIDKKVEEKIEEKKPHFFETLKIAVDEKSNRIIIGQLDGLKIVKAIDRTDDAIKSVFVFLINGGKAQVTDKSGSIYELVLSFKR